MLYLTIQANEDVTQIVEILPSVTDKWTWLTRRLVSFTSGTVKKKSLFFYSPKKKHIIQLSKQYYQKFELKFVKNYLPGLVFFLAAIFILKITLKVTSKTLWLF